MKRREVLAAMTAAPLALAGGCATSAGSKEDKGTLRKLERFGLQLSTVTPALMADFDGTLGRVAAIGYKQVEFSALGFLGRSADDVASLLEVNSLEAPVGRISPRLPEGFRALSREEQFAAFRTYSGPDHLLSNVRVALQDAAELGQKHLILPALMPDNFATRSQVQASIDLLRQAGELCAKADVRFGYHNHDWEFAPVEGVIPFDLMLDTIDPELMSVQLDVYWVSKAGADPLAYFSAHPNRFPACHLKDMNEDGDFEDVGFGVLDFPSIVAGAQAAGTEYYFVERDNPPEPMRTAERAYAYLQQLRF